MRRTFSVVRGAILSAVLVLVAGCGAATPPGPRSLPTSPDLSECRAEPARAVVCLRAGENRAEGALLVGEARQEAIHGSYCWRAGGGRQAACVDTAWPLFPRGYVEVPKGVELLVNADSETVGLFLYRVIQRDGRRELGRARDVELVRRTARLRVEPGRYLLEAVATWPEGDADLVFGIRVAARKG